MYAYHEEEVEKIVGQYTTKRKFSMQADINATNELSTQFAKMCWALHSEFMHAGFSSSNAHDLVLNFT